MFFLMYMFLDIITCRELKPLAPWIAWKSNRPGVTSAPIRPANAARSRLRLHRQARRKEKENIMQTVTLSKEKNTACSIKQDNSDIRYFSLQDTLPTGHILVLNISSGTLSYLRRRDGERAQLTMQQQFTFSE